jgi:hypothetical protein
MSDAPAVQLRVHGVGGPQGPKMLGELFETDTVTLPPITGELTRPDGTKEPYTVPCDTKSRVVRRVDDLDIHAYEWGGLTLGGILHALWVVYLPLTILNAAGWAHRPGSGRPTRLVMHVLCCLGTVTYVGWIGYVMLDIVGRQWREHLMLAMGHGAPFDVIRCCALPLAHVLFFAVLGAFVWVNASTGKSFEHLTFGEQDLPWTRETRVFDRGFFAHSSSYDKLRLGHSILIGATAVGVTVLGAIERHPKGATSIGLGLVVLASAQLAILTVWWLSTPWTGGMSQVALATIGTVLCHATFAGSALLVSDQLAKRPAVGDSVTPFVSGLELGLSDHFFIALVAIVISVGVLVVYVLNLHDPFGGYPPDNGPGVPVRLVSRAVGGGATIALSLTASYLLFVAIHIPKLGEHAKAGTSWWHYPFVFYDNYLVTPNTAQKLGSLVLTAIPVAILLVLRKPRESAPGRIVGNVWDVLTFWPRRYHPFAVPPYAERAVPELRMLIREHRRNDRPLVTLGHSQGSVLLFTALGAELESPGMTTAPLLFVTFGSPLGTLYSNAFPAYFGDSQRREVADRIGAAGGAWRNLFRSTDAISGPVVSGSGTEVWDDVWLPDPRTDDFEWSGDVSIPLRPPLERPPQWGVAQGHNRYLADPKARQIVSTLS